MLRCARASQADAVPTSLLTTATGSRCCPGNPQKIFLGAVGSFSFQHSLTPVKSQCPCQWPPSTVHMPTNLEQHSGKAQLETRQENHTFHFSLLWYLLRSQGPVEMGTKLPVCVTEGEKRAQGDARAVSRARSRAALSNVKSSFLVPFCWHSPWHWNSQGWRKQHCSTRVWK